MESESLRSKRIWILVGTRPEVIKQVPVYLECVRIFGLDRVALIGTGQHRELLEQALRAFNVTLDYNMDIMRPDQSLVSLSSEVLRGMETLLLRMRPDWVVVQGDTTTASMAAWASFLNQIKVAHNEAGLRSYDLENRFPEEANRKLISAIASLHFAPTSRARDALVSEGVLPARILVTGNPSIDSLRATLDRPMPPRVADLLALIRTRGLRPVLLTAHRRENRGRDMLNWFRALAQFLSQHPELCLILLAHPNRASSEAAGQYLSSLDRAFIVPPMGYTETCHLLRHCAFVVTDSGGLQEEAGSLGIPAVVCRRTTERMEGVDAGIARLAGTDTDDVIRGMDWANSFYQSSRSQESFRDLYGDGHSAPRIAAALAGFDNNLRVPARYEISASVH